MGTLTRALEVRDIPVPRGKIRAEVEGDIEAVSKVMRITRIRVHYVLVIPPGTRKDAERALETHPAGCPAWNTVRNCIEINIDADITEKS